MTSKKSIKPLKGNQDIESGLATASFETIRGASVFISNLTIENVFEDNVWKNIKITDTIIENTRIGFDSPESGFFTSLNASTTSLLGQIKIENNVISTEIGSIILSPDTSLNLPSDTPIIFDSVNSITGNTNTFNINSNSTLNLSNNKGSLISLQSSGNIQVGDTLTVNSTGSINFSGTQGLLLSSNNKLFFGNTTNSIFSNGTDMFLTGSLNITSANINTLSYGSERLSMASGSLTSSPSLNSMITLLGVSGNNLQTSGTMPNLGLVDGQIKILICSAMGTASSYSLHFDSGKLITPNPRDTSTPTKIVFKRRGQSLQLIWDNIESNWKIFPGGAYIL